MYTIIKEFVEILLIIQYSSELNALDKMIILIRS